MRGANPRRPDFTLEDNNMQDKKFTINFNPCNPTYTIPDSRMVYRIIPMQIVKCSNSDDCIARKYCLRHLVNRGPYSTNYNPENGFDCSGYYPTNLL